MTNFRKIVRIGTQLEWTLNGDKQAQSHIFCKIKFEEGKLSISGVIHPTSNGDCRGSCGQILDDIEPDHYAKGWGKNKLKKFLEIWDMWHLNDMKPYTPDMKAAGWDKLASKEIFKYSFGFTNEARKELRELKDKILKAGIEGKTIPLSDRQKRLLGTKSSKYLYGYTQPETPEFMELQTDILSHDKRPKIERKTLGWVNVEDHPDGLLGRELNGEKYGCKWYKHEVPQDAIEFLKALPDTDKKPAWV